ncbi:unnamed protein product [Scytosiphon promiscuus]
MGGGDKRQQAPRQPLRSFRCPSRASPSDKRAWFCLCQQQNTGSTHALVGASSSGAATRGRTEAGMGGDSSDVGQRTRSGQRNATADSMDHTWFDLDNLRSYALTNRSRSSTFPAAPRGFPGSSPASKPCVRLPFTSRKIEHPGFVVQCRAPVGVNRDASAAVLTARRRCGSSTAAAPAAVSMTSRENTGLRTAAATVLLGGALLFTGGAGSTDLARADVSISPRCITGEGAQCDDLAEGNELIKSLQAKSALSKDRYFQETLDTYNQHNFKDYFKAEGKHMVKHKTGKYEIITNAEYVDLEKAGKVKNDVFLEED